MILFVGCSFTWGAGLQFEYLSKKRGWTSDEINAINPPKSYLENLDYKCDEYRKKHHYPNLVAKEMNMGYVMGKLGNGGTNYEFPKILKHVAEDGAGAEPILADAAEAAPGAAVGGDPGERLAAGRGREVER